MTTWSDLTGFQRDVLEETARLERDGEDPYGLAIKEMLEEQHGEVLHGQLYQNLNTLVDDGLLERDELDGRTNSYTLTSDAKAMLEESIYRRADACELLVTDGGER
ncbi:PadR family transcriptional regulator [Natribaculum luteum]|uniref:PadR family transcriptional regulator n=1 Tax=Natribaculum luteum TaxID=1586232 RepID=A0ABD5NWM7_9EURY|nr:helix-turn-helix transcriptional regulator [Natribaculum luteum]